MSFFNHLNELNVTYVEHFKIAINGSYLSLKAAIYLLIHAFIPDLFREEGTKTIKHLHYKINEIRNKKN